MVRLIYSNSPMRKLQLCTLFPRGLGISGFHDRHVSTQAHGRVAFFKNFGVRRVSE